MMDGQISEIQIESEQNEPETPKKSNYNRKKAQTGAKVAILALSMISLVGGLVAIAGIDRATGGKQIRQETKRAEQLVELYRTDDSVCEFPTVIATSISYDTKYCEGEQLVSELNENNIKYCELLDEYYTPEGKNIAILTYEARTMETIDAQTIEIDGTYIYMAPAGYVLNGDKCYKETTYTIKKIVEAIPNSTYENIVIGNVASYELIDVTELPTKKYSEIANRTLICDVADEATLDQNGTCKGTLKLVPKK